LMSSCGGELAKGVGGQFVICPQSPFLQLAGQWQQRPLIPTSVIIGNEPRAAPSPN
jgi:hypothetical protein